MRSAGEFLSADHCEAMQDGFDLERFVAAQAPVYDDVVAELTAGCKRTHWMWFVFPQLAGLGSSAMAQRYAISGIDEARAYAAHELLGARLIDCARLVLRHRVRTALSIMGSPDDLKLQSSMTLFEQATPKESVFAEALDAFYGGRRDQRSLALLIDGRDSERSEG